MSAPTSNDRTSGSRNTLAPWLLALSIGSGGCGRDPLTFSDANNYSYSGTVDIPSFPTAERVNVEICFDAVTEDIQCHALDPAADIVTLGMGRFLLSEEELEDKLGGNTLQQSEATGYVEIQPQGQTCVNTGDLSFFGTPIDVPNDYYTGPAYMVLLTDTTTPAQGTRALAILLPSKDSDVTRVDLSPECGVLDFTADLASAASLPVSEKDTEVDWSGVQSDGLGAQFDPTSPNLLTLAHYTDETVENLQDNFFDIELLADTQWNLDLKGEKVADLSTATTDGGDAFPGFESSGIYLLGLRDTGSPNPAPLFLTVLTPE
jgi:hypothetical protein